MIRNFDEVKKQLSDLAGIINSFKSEAVQLRIVDLIFQGVRLDRPVEAKETDVRVSAPRRVRTSTARGKKRAGNSDKKKGPTGRGGPASLLSELINEGYFKEKRVLKEIIDYCANKKARTLKANELSGPLGRFVRDHRLDRDPNKDGQYEYFKK
jgi:hypothetical protein